MRRDRRTVNSECIGPSSVGGSGPTPRHAICPAAFGRPHDAYPDRRGHDVSPTPDYVMGLMRGVIDPELGSDIVELGMAKVPPSPTTDGSVSRSTSPRAAAPWRPDPKGHPRSTDLVARGHPGHDRLGRAHPGRTVRGDGQGPLQRQPERTRYEHSFDHQGRDGRLREGRCRQIVDHHQPGCGTRRAGVRRRGDGRRHLGLLGPRMLGVDGDLVSKDGKIQPLVREIGTGAWKSCRWASSSTRRTPPSVARPHAQPCRSALLSGRRLAERSRLPPDRHAARHRRCADGPRQDAAPGRDVDRHNTGAQRPEGRARVADMGAKNYLRIVGVIENMSEFVAPDGSRHSLFGEGGGQQLADDIGAPLLGQVPIEPAVSVNGDQGDPAALGETPRPSSSGRSPGCSPRSMCHRSRWPAAVLVCSMPMAALDALDENESSTEPAGDARRNPPRRPPPFSSSSGGSSGRS